MSSPKPQVASQPFPHDELAALDKENVERLLAINTKLQSFFSKHPFFEADPVCRLARQMCLQTLPEYAQKEGGADRLVVNGGYEPQGGPAPMTYEVGPGPGENSLHDPKHWAFVSFLTAGNRPRPIWMAWIPQARAAIEALKLLEAVDAS